jgi:hypothetical protein
LAVYGLITQGAVLQSGVKLILHGRSAATSPSNQARAIIHGTVAGRIYNKVAASRFSAWSMLSKISHGAVTVIDAAAHVRRGRATVHGSKRA